MMVNHFEISSWPGLWVCFHLVIRSTVGHVLLSNVYPLLKQSTGNPNLFPQHFIMVAILWSQNVWPYWPYSYQVRKSILDDIVVPDIVVDIMRYLWWNTMVKMVSSITGQQPFRRSSARRCAMSSRRMTWIQSVWWRRPWTAGFAKEMGTSALVGTLLTSEPMAYFNKGFYFCDFSGKINH